MQYKEYAAAIRTKRSRCENMRDGHPRSSWVTLLAPGLLWACSTDVRSTRLADVDLSDMAVVQSLGQRLAADQRAAFSNYVWQHRISSAGFCGNPLVDHQGRDPLTIGEAIDLTIARDREEAQRIANKPQWAYRWEELTRERDRLMDRQGLMLAQHGPGAQERPEWRTLQDDLARNGEAMAQARPSSATSVPAKQSR